MKAAAIIAALGIALIVTMGPDPASAQTTVVRECGDHYVVTRYNSDGTVKGVWNKQLSAAGTIYTAGKTWKLVEGNPDRFVSDGGAQLQVVACDATPGSSTRGVQQQGAQGAQATTLVGNTGQTAGLADVDVRFDHAQAFTTGSNSSGYTLTSVELNLRNTGTLATFIVTLHADSSGTPSTTSLGTLTTTTALTSNYGLVQFDAAGTGISLDASTTYWVVVDVSAISADTDIQTTTSDDQDSGAATGWSIANDRIARAPGATDWSTIGTDQSAVHIRIKGSAKTQTPQTPPPVFTSGDDGRRVAPGPWISPRVNRADLSGTTVTVSMDKAVRLDEANYTLAQLADKFTVWVNEVNQTGRQTIESASVSGYRVTLKLGSSAPPGARVWVNYSRGPLLDATTSEKRVVGGFSLSPGPWATPRPNRVYGTATGVVVSMDKPVQLDSDYSDSQIKAAFTVRVNGTAHEPTGVTVSGRDISLTIDDPPADGDKLDVDYTKGPLLDSTGMRILGFAYFGAGR
ncbi:MAG: SwmB domain-containing protein [Gemmatimonadetes bacterium]|nr:SwmB domain-containing protein [Gemmatimonadota bacterium]